MSLGVSRGPGGPGELRPSPSAGKGRFSKERGLNPPVTTFSVQNLPSIYVRVGLNPRQCLPPRAATLPALVNEPQPAPVGGTALLAVKALVDDCNSLCPQPQRWGGAGWGADQPPRKSLSPSPWRVSNPGPEGMATRSADLPGARLTAGRPAGSRFLPRHSGDALQGARGAAISCGLQMHKTNS